MTDTIESISQTPERVEASKSVLIWNAVGQGATAIIAAIAVLTGVLQLLVGVVDDSNPAMFAGVALIFAAAAFAGIFMSILTYIEWRVRSATELETVAV